MSRLERGMTLLELMIGSIIFALFIVLTMGAVATQARMARDANLATGELLAAQRLAALFRADVRAAREAAASPDGKRLALKLDDLTVTYALDKSLHIQRLVGGVLDVAGPRLLALSFGLKEKQAGGRALVAARWLCAADQDSARPEHRPGAGRLLVLDTAVRSSGEQ